MIDAICEATEWVERWIFRLVLAWLLITIAYFILMIIVLPFGLGVVSLMMLVIFIEYMVPIWIGVFVLVGAMEVVHVAYKLLEGLRDFWNWATG